MFQRFYDYQRERESKANLKIALFSIFAGAVGLAAGFLSSKENRDQVSTIAKDLGDKAQEVSKQAIEKAKDYSEVASVKVNDVKRKATRKLNEIEDRIDSAFNKESDIELVPVRDDSEE